MTGPQSPVLKFSPTMCKVCNNVRSKPFDDAYDQFIAYVDAQAHSILASNQISLSQVYGANWQASRDSLVRYFVKHICCRLAEPHDGFRVEIDPQLIQYLDGGPEPDCLELDLYIERVYLRIWRIFELANDPVNVPAGFVGFAPVRGELELESGIFRRPQSALGYGWLWLAWQVGSEVGFISPFSNDVIPLRRTTTMPWRARLLFAFGEARARAANLIRRPASP
jgi:hypothetical protein